MPSKASRQPRNRRTTQAQASPHARAAARALDTFPAVVLSALCHPSADGSSLCCPHSTPRVTTRQPTTLPSHLFCVPSCFNVVLLFCSNRFAQKPARDAVRLAWMERDDEIAAVRDREADLAVLPDRQNEIFHEFWAWCTPKAHLRTIFSVWKCVLYHSAIMSGIATVSWRGVGGLGPPLD
jgi:hypothetical protein